jgi:hypothetical protein
MFFLFSGEGSTDLGTCIHLNMINKDKNYLYGPLTVVVDQIVEKKHSYSLIQLGIFGFVPEAMIQERSKTLRPKPKSGNIPGVRSKKETRFFYRNARALAKIAQQYCNEHRNETNENEVVAIFFRDGDKPNERGNWNDKRNSMLEGFQEESFDRGVPMIPASVSEAWMLCGLYKQRDLQRNCDYLENETYGSGSQHKLKDKLKEELKETPDRETLCEKVRTREINFDLVDLSSYKKFKARLEEVIY